LSKGKGANRAAVVERREQVKALIVHGLAEREICRALSVSKSTVIRDIQAIADDWTVATKVQYLYSVRQAFDFLMALMREYWVIYHRAPREFPGPDGSVVKEDRSRVQLRCLDGLVEVVKVLNQMAGIGSARMFERLRYLESERARGFEITRISYHDQLQAKVKRVRNDLEWQKREGLIRDSPSTSSP
jgi:hypothetical protein